MIAANQSRLQVTGTTQEDMIGRNLFDAFPDNPNDPVTEGVRNLQASLQRVLRDKVPDKMAVQKYDIPIPGSNPQAFEERYWSPINIPILNDKGDVVYILHQVEDVTSLILSQDRQDEMASEIYRRSEEVRAINVELKLAKELLEQKVEERTAELNQAKEAAETASQMKSAFLANMSHEIRTPLGAIIGFTDLLKEGHLPPHEQDQFLNAISRNGRALTRLIDDILDLAKVEAGRMDIEMVNFSLYDLMSDAVELFRAKARQKNIYLLLNIDKSTPDTICSDPSRLRQILVNLIGNAVKFTNDGGVHVDVRKIDAGDGNLKFQIDIKDSGIGLTPSQQAKLFQPFAQADSSMAREYGGTGLGLALSKRLSEALGGDIKISNCVAGKGCTFCLTFPAFPDVASNKPQNLNQQRPKNFSEDFHFMNRKQDSLKGVRILAVDDSPENLFLVKRTLLNHGAFVDTSTNGEDALQKALHQRFDLILMDLQMPKMDGYESKKALDEHGYHGPIVALTAHAMKQDRQKTKEAGFSAHLAKPLNQNELVNTVAGVVLESRHHHISH